jgi:hypothetical protein
MRVLRKLLVVLVVMLIVVASAIALLFVYLPETDLIRDGLCEKLKTLTGHEVTVGSLKLSFSFPAFVNIKLSNISVASAKGEPLLQTTSAELSPSLLSLVGGHIDVESVTVNGLRAFVRKPPELPKAPPPTPGETPVPEKAVEPQPEAKMPEGSPVSPPRPETQAEPEAARRVRWSVKSLKVASSSIEWIDGRTVPGKELKLSVRDLNGSLTRDKEGKGFTFNLNGTIGEGPSQGSPIALNGTIQPNDDLSALKSALVNCRAEAVEVSAFIPYLPPKAESLAQFDRANVLGRVNWKKGSPCNISVNSQLSADAPEQAQLSLQGDVVTNDSFSTVDSAEISGETDLLPLKFVGGLLPESIPFDRDAGYIKASVQGKLRKDRTWEAKGSVGLEKAVPSGLLRGLGKQVRVWVNFAMDPESINLESLEISQSERVASIRGTILNPFSEQRKIDLNGEADFQPRWLSAAGVKLPEGLRLDGVIAVTGRVQTRDKAFKVTLDGDLVPTHVRWLPYAEKKSGAKGHIAFSGTIVPGKKPAGLGSRGTLRLGLDGVAVQLVPGVRALPGATVQWSSKIAVTMKGIDLRDAVVAIKQGPASPDLIRADANLTGLGTPLGRIDGSARLHLDNEVLALTGYKPQHGWAVSGHTTLKAKFAGSPSALNWEIEGPLSHLGLAVENAFKKPEGVNGEVKVVGKWGEQGLQLNKAGLTLPGVVVTGHGKLVDRKGEFNGLTLDLKKTDVKALAAFVTPLAGKGLSGPIEATVQLSRSDKGIAHSGTIRTAALAYRPPKAEWWLDSLKGTVKVEGDKVDFPKIDGRVRGAVEAPLKAAGTLNGVSSQESMAGRVSLELGHGKIKADRIRSIMNQAQLLIGTILNPQAPQQQSDLLDFDFVKGDLQIKAGTLRTDDLRLKGADLRIGVIGSLRLATQELDALAGVHTVMSVNSALGEVPIVRETVKKHRGLLKALGVEKELKRFGIDVDASKKQGEQAPKTVKTPLTVMFRLRGPATSPKPEVVLEASLDKKTAARLKELME